LSGFAGRPCCAAALARNLLIARNVPKTFWHGICS
jgi:hypothetical protein